eukprot:TRINITY_DN5404_c0_g1_i1.p1 TRINITY_DN5404_c0_g1~~TRINITY_DN5404_c0_g1_i1.p1  ORF type:complete len:451 (+),score=50.43 TRINITY_DN5404_c0_g1_i1:59-1411(+)
MAAEDAARADELFDQDDHAADVARTLISGDTLRRPPGCRALPHVVVCLVSAALLICGLTVRLSAPGARVQRRSGGVLSLEELSLTNSPSENLTYNTIFNRTLKECVSKNPWSQVAIGKCYDWLYGRDEYCRPRLPNGTCDQIANCLTEKPFDLDDPCAAACSFGHPELQQPVHVECAALFEKVLEFQRSCLEPDARSRAELAQKALEPYLAQCRSYRTTSTTTWIDGSLFCFALVVPWSYEVGLIEMQEKAKAGIFQCGDSAVYSDRTVEIGNIKTRKVQVNLHCPFNPYTRTVENTPVFIKLWRQVMEDGLWRYHDWTVKVDPDTVFSPLRLTHILNERSPALSGRRLNGAWINNCWHELHGPIEILSRNGVSTFNQSIERCPAWPLQEDNYFQHCMGIIQVAKLDSFNVLAEANCDRPYYWNCQGSFAAFHPFKSKSAWKHCWDVINR